ncbi:MAG: hypothetical protein WCS03_08050 [Bacteroidota bacterium]
MGFIVFKSDGDDIIINSDKIVSVTIDPKTKKTFIQTEKQKFTVNESMEVVKKTLHTIPPWKKGVDKKVIASRI